MKKNSEPAPPPPQSPQPNWLEVVRESVSDMRFGTVQIVVHEGRVTQVDATRRTRLNSEPVSQ